MTWHSVHVHFHDEERANRFAATVVRRALAATADAAPHAYFVRHWRRGPHFRLNFRTDAHTFSHEVLPRVRETAERGMARLPSRGTARPTAETVRAHRRLAWLEDDPCRLLPWRRDNSVTPEPYACRRAALGEAGAGLLEDFHVDTTALALRMAGRSQTAPERARTAFDLMVTTAHALSGLDVRDGFVSFRSHAETYLCTAPEGPALRPVWSARSRRDREALAHRVRTLVRTLDDGDRGGTAAAGGLPAEWVRAATAVRQRAERLLTDGTLVLPAVGRSLAGPGVRDAPEYLLARSRFHRALLQQRYFREVHRDSLPFALYRVMLNITYLQLARIGVHAHERFLLCHLAADAVEHAFGVRAEDRIAWSAPAAP
ncbi:thiopeptide maturation pyridine synthase [Streptomyces nanhaiensis]|uniref:thiopeptide maturation pyridine synthase n=1 Tax=Streptomyces nanhaiensis TaxID=679319 RepID=UPI00399CB473